MLRKVIYKISLKFLSKRIVKNPFDNRQRKNTLPLLFGFYIKKNNLIKNKVLLTMKRIKENFINIVLFEPEIPANTGNIGRLCVGLDIKLHLIEPLGFKLTAKEIKRAGMDYWKNLDIERYSSLDDFFGKTKSNNIGNISFYFASTKATKSYFDIKYCDGDYIIFGKESAGLPDVFHSFYKERGISIPMSGKIRSINLSNSCAIIAYEALRQLTMNN